MSIPDLALTPARPRAEPATLGAIEEAYARGYQDASQAVEAYLAAARSDVLEEAARGPLPDIPQKLSHPAWRVVVEDR